MTTQLTPETLKMLDEILAKYAEWKIEKGACRQYPPMECWDNQPNPMTFFRCMEAIAQSLGIPDWEDAYNPSWGTFNTLYYDFLRSWASGSFGQQDNLACRPKAIKVLYNILFS